MGPRGRAEALLQSFFLEAQPFLYTSQPLLQAAEPGLQVANAAPAPWERVAWGLMQHFLSFFFFKSFFAV